MNYVRHDFTDCGFGFYVEELPKTTLVEKMLDPSCVLTVE